MTSDTRPEPLTVRTFLFGDEDDASRVRELAEALDEQGVGKSLGSSVGGLSHAGYQAAEGQLAATADRLLDVDLGTLVVAGWYKWGRLVDAAKATAREPEATELVTLEEQRIVSQRRPHVDVVVDGVRVATFTFVLTLEFLVEALAAVVRQGRLVAIRSGTTVVTGTLAIAGSPRPLKQCRRTVDLARVVDLGAGIPLVRQHAVPDRPGAPL